MKGLLLKDFYTTVKYCKAYFLIVAVFLVISLFSTDNSLFVTIYPTLIAGILPVTLLSYDERDKWTQYCGVLPYTRKDFVSSKYLTGLFFGVASIAVSVIAYGVRTVMSGSFSPFKLLALTAVLFIMGLAMPSLLLPFVFKLGAEKGRLVFYVMIGFLCAASVLINGFGLQWITPKNQLFTPFVLIAATAVIYFISWSLSVHFYKKKDL